MEPGMERAAMILVFAALASSCAGFMAIASLLKMIKELQAENNSLRQQLESTQIKEVNP